MQGKKKQEVLEQYFLDSVYSCLQGIRLRGEEIANEDDACELQRIAVVLSHPGMQIRGGLLKKYARTCKLILESDSSETIKKQVFKCLQIIRWED